MTVFKGYLLMTKKNIGFICMYFGIFVLLAMISTSNSGNNLENGFTEQELKMLVVDEDHSGLSGIVTKYLKEHHEVTLGENDKKALYEQLYYQKVDLVIYIPKGMEKDVEKDENAIELTQSPGSYGGIYVEQQISRLISSVLDYRDVGYSMEEAYQKIADAPETKVSVVSEDGKLEESSKFSDFFRCVPYMFIAGLGTGLSAVIFYFRKKQIKMRMMASSVSLMRQNGEGVLAVLLVGIALYLITILIVLARYGTEFFQTPTLLYYLLNLFIDMLLALAMAFMVGLLVKKLNTVMMCFTSLSLAFSFLGGVFVQLEYLSSEMLIIAKFIPVYWYEVVNDLLMSYSNISGSVRTQIWQAYGMQMLFVVAFFAAGLVIAKRQQQEG